MNAQRLGRTPLAAIAWSFLTILVAACSGAPIEDWSRVPEPKEPQVLTMRHAHEVRFVADQSALDAAEAARLSAFVARLGADREDRVRLVAGPAPAEVRSARTATVARFLARQGMVVGPAQPDADEVTASPGTVRVVVRRALVTLPGCPDWSGRPGRTFNNMVSTNFGCASAINLGLMVARPEDLRRGRRMAPIDGDFAVLGVQRYRKGATRPLDGGGGGGVELQGLFGGAEGGSQ